MKSLIGKQFTSASQLPAGDAKIIRSQPGYRDGEPMMLAQTKSGGIRLYVLVSGRWMDASLEDIPTGAGRPLSGAERRAKICYSIAPETAAAIESDRREGESKGQVLDRWAMERQK